MDALLEIASAAGEIRCCLADDNGLRFELPGDETCEVEIDAARSKLRMLCARLSVLCNETPGSAVSPYGGVGVIRVQSQNGNGATQPQWTVRFKNTPGEHEFTVTPTMAESPPIAAKRRAAT
jgi:hypothetical protein